MHDNRRRGGQPSRYFQAMAHTKAKPEHERPTLAEMEFHDAAAKQEPRFVVWKITGVWTLNREAIFDIVVKGDISDIHETYAMLTENGNLDELKFDDITS